MAPAKKLNIPTCGAEQNHLLRTSSGETPTKTYTNRMIFLRSTKSPRIRLSELSCLTRLTTSDFAAPKIGRPLVAQGAAPGRESAGIGRRPGGSRRSAGARSNYAPHDRDLRNPRLQPSRNEHLRKNGRGRGSLPGDKEMVYSRKAEPFHSGGIQ